MSTSTHSTTFHASTQLQPQSISSIVEQSTSTSTQRASSSSTSSPATLPTPNPNTVKTTTSNYNNYYADKDLNWWLQLARNGKAAIKVPLPDGNFDGDL